MARAQLKWSVRLPASLIVALAVVSCGSAAQGPIVIPPTPTGVTTLGSTVPPGRPVSVDSSAPKVHGLPVEVDIPAIGVHARDIAVTGLNKDGSPSTPPVSKPQQLGVYGLGAQPCSAGPAKVPMVLIGHIDGNGRSGVFVDLKNLQAGNTVSVALDSGVKCTYRITKLASFDKTKLANGADKAAAKEIWGSVSQGEIRIISCGGRYVGAPLFYQDNLVGFGSLVS